MCSGQQMIWNSVQFCVKRFFGFLIINGRQNEEDFLVQVDFLNGSSSGSSSKKKRSRKRKKKISKNN